MAQIQILKKQTLVRQIIQPIQGKIINQGLHDGELKYLVQFVDKDNETHTRWFEQSEVEEIK